MTGCSLSNAQCSAYLCGQPCGQHMANIKKGTGRCPTVDLVYTEHLAWAELFITEQQWAVSSAAAVAFSLSGSLLVCLLPAILTSCARPSCFFCTHNFFGEPTTEERDGVLIVLHPYSIGTLWLWRKEAILFFLIFWNTKNAIKNWYGQFGIKIFK